MADREGFEPSVPLSEYDGLANRWFQPLTHLSVGEDVYHKDRPCPKEFCA